MLLACLWAMAAKKPEAGKSPASGLYNPTRDMRFNGSACG
jgi:hypothetical protein